MAVALPLLPKEQLFLSHPLLGPRCGPLCAYALGQNYIARSTSEERVGAIMDRLQKEFARNGMRVKFPEIKTAEDVDKIVQKLLEAMQNGADYCMYDALIRTGQVTGPAADAFHEFAQSGKLLLVKKYELAREWAAKYASDLEKVERLAPLFFQRAQLGDLSKLPNLEVIYCPPSERGGPVLFNAVPDSLAGLPSLKELHMPDCAIRALPDVRGLKELRVVDLSGNPIDNLSDALKMLPDTITSLALNRLGIQKFPEELFRFPHLKKLSLQGNEIEEFPDDIRAHFPKLEEFDLQDNPLKSKQALIF